ncbi:FlgD immunoglobulin-like domain containing protein [Tenacibaculum agarivorans]|uniref:FlgD immunoglobulin-like domain containing protein n=1 Tax=Tenacibaculum agarivorans TaxID=1908389 RepID=UPI00094B8154|nr:FlgD immunoglobulin-like domain containing protein [Tenacibaculum agarivorans]
MRIIFTSLLFFCSFILNAQNLSGIERDDAIENEHYGWNVETSNSFIVVGSPNTKNSDLEDAGAIHIYQKLNERWQRFQDIKSPNPSVFENFGYTIAIYGDYLAVSAIGSFKYGPFTGAVYLYKNSGVTWDLDKIFYPETQVPNQWYGYSLAMNEDYLVVGAINANGVNAESGEVFVYKDYTKESNVEVSTLATATQSKNDKFGYDVAISSNNKILVGAPYVDGHYENCGTAYLYTLNEENKWNVDQTFKPQSGGISDLFGTSVDLHDSNLVIGAMLGDGNEKNSGIVYGYNYNNTSKAYEFTQKIEAAEGELNDYFGISLKLYQDVLLVGAPRSKTENNSHAGKAYVFKKEGGTWLESKVLKEPTSKEDNHFGSDVALAQGHIVISSRLNDDLATDAGEVYVSEFDETLPIDLESITGSSVKSFPIPSDTQVSVTYKLFKSTQVSLTIVDVNGKEVKTILRDTAQQPGDYNITWDLTTNTGVRASSGLYVYKLMFNGNTFSGKLLVH